MLYNAEHMVVTKQVKGDTVTVIDTQYIKDIIKGETDTVKVDTTIYVDVPYMDSVEMRRLVELYMAKSIQYDTLDIKYGNVYITDTVQMNRVRRTWNASIKVPVEKKYITIPEQPKNEFYFGPNVTVIPKPVIGVGGLFKSKNDRIYGLSIGVGKSGLSYGATYMVKL